MTDEQLIEAMARAIMTHRSAMGSDLEWRISTDADKGWYRGLATAALAKVDEVYHRIPKDQEPVGRLIDGQYFPIDQSFCHSLSEGQREWGWTETPLYAIPEKRHD